MTLSLVEYSVVALGSMNPPIHHPQFYQRMGLVTDEQVQQSLESKALIFVPQLSQFLIGSTRITCEENRWQIRSKTADAMDQFKKIASEIFDIHLPHTPISAVGFNFAYGQNCNMNVAEKIGQLATTALDVGIEKPSSGEIKVTDTSSEFHVSVVVRSVSPNDFVAATNIHIPVKEVIGDSIEFHVSEFIGKYFDSELHNAEKRAEHIAKQLVAED